MVARADERAIALIGFGEAARALVSGWGLGGSGRVSAFDIKVDEPADADEMLAAYRSAGVAGAMRPDEALAGAPVVFSLVTSDQTLQAATAAAPHLATGAIWLDCNSAAPDTKRAAAAAIEAVGGRYVDVAIMAPIKPRRHRTPMLLAGPAANDARKLMEALDMRPRVVGDRVGDASAIKMIRSVMIKGLEALTAECLLAARRAGVADAVLESLARSDPGFDWATRSAYCLERMMVHGTRRAAEMREAAATVRALGLPDRLTRATVDWQEQIAALGLPAGDDNLIDRADRILASL
jgi:3-hydroxyisobutyrate dehydrogenase-like beta-hydroxyacid dehydrogenase